MLCSVVLLALMSTAEAERALERRARLFRKSLVEALQEVAAQGK